jgi:TRAP-type uncharacterized transport system substrate-binding protein
LATGPEGSAYAELGPAYRRILQRSGIAVRLLATDGDVDNLAKLSDRKSGVSAAFVQAGIATDEQRAHLASLGTLMYSPLWVFVRGDLPGLGLGDLGGRPLSIGPAGSGTRFQVLKLFGLVHVDPKSLRLEAFTPVEAERALLRGELDALALSDSWDALVVRRLLADPRAALIGFPRADAYVALDPYLSKLVVPMGVGDLAKNLPRTDAPLLASKTSLLIRDDLHPALQYLLLDAASRIHGRPSLFERAGQFPAGEPMDVPLSSEARQFYKAGPPFLHRYLPFWLAVLVEQLMLLLIPFVAIAYPLFRILPGLYDQWMHRRILVLYGELKILEGDVERLPAGENTSGLLERIDALERRSGRLRVPLKFTQSLYHLKSHIDLVRSRLARSTEETLSGQTKSPERS